MSNRQRILILCIPILSLFCLPGSGSGQDIDTLLREGNDLPQQFLRLVDQARYREAEQLVKGAIRDYERQGDDGVLLSSTWGMLAEIYQRVGRDEDAERAALRGMELAKRTGYTSSSCLQMLAIVRLNQRRFAEAEAGFRQVLALTEQEHGTDNSIYAEVLENLAIVLDDTGRFQDAEQIYQRALAIKHRKRGPKSSQVAFSYNNLGYFYYQHSRLDDAYAYLRHAVKLFEELSGPNAIVLQRPLANLAIVCKDSQRWEEAKAHQLRLKQILLNEYGADDVRTRAADLVLGDLLVAQKKYAEAEPLFSRYLDFQAQQAEPNKLSQAGVEVALAEVYLGLGRLAEAEELSAQALVTSEKLDFVADHRCWSYFVRGKILHARQKLDSAIAALRESVKLAEDIRSRLSGSDQERAGAFSASLREKYLLLFRVLLEKGDLPAAIAIAEQGRARSLVDQMQTAHADLLAGLPIAQAQALRQAMNRAEAQVAQLERQLAAAGADTILSAEDRKARQEELTRQLMVARNLLVDAHTAIRNASPLYRKTLANDFQSVPLQEVDAWLIKRKSCLLYYVLDNEKALVVARGPQQRDQIVQQLEVTPEQAKLLGIAAGPLSGEILEQVLQSKTGVLPQLANPKTDKLAEPHLAVLWEVLVPAEIRAALLKEEYNSLVIVPDGVLGLLPFETLIVAAGEQPKYLLDVGPPIIYAPSLTLLHTLADRAAEAPKAKSEPILTIGDPIYSAGPSDPAQARAAGLQTRYGTLGGKLLRLPYTASESHWVKQAFQPAGWSSVQLLEAQATEANVRSKIAGRTIVHLACHGLADQTYGNFFGALALTPGPRGTSTSANDGFLTLSEVCELDLRGNELTMLSACQTNYGPQQQGEGVWALTRGFLVAGSRRVMASNWVVDDKAAATLVFFYATNIADGQKNDNLDYALALQKAKRAVRKQAKWESPFYWGSMVLVGPN